MSDLRPAAETAVRQCMNLGSAESCVIVTDDERLRIGEALYGVARETTDDAALLRYPPGPQHGAEPPEPVAGAMAAADVALAPTTKSLSHTRARSDASEAGARIATLPGITEDVFITGLDADYGRIREECDRALERVADVEEVRVTSPQGTDIAVRPGEREWRVDTGIVHDPGAFSNLPAGEIFVSPETADGTYVVDGTIHPHGLVEEPIRIEVEDGHVTSIDDPEVSRALEEAAAEVGRDASNLAELGIGMNVAVADLVGSVLLDEKAAGTVHLAFGDDAGIGGDTDAPLHVDGILREPTVYVDGEEMALPRPG